MIWATFAMALLLAFVVAWAVMEIRYLRLRIEDLDARLQRAQGEIDAEWVKRNK